MDHHIKESPAREEPQNRTLDFAASTHADFAKLVGRQAAYKATSAPRLADHLLDLIIGSVGKAVGDTRWSTLADAAFVLARLSAAGHYYWNDVRPRLHAEATAAGMTGFTPIIDAAFFESTCPSTPASMRDDSFGLFWDGPPTDSPPEDD